MASGYVLGISAFYHDSAACLLSGDVIVAAAQEERFTRVKGDERFPVHAATYCLAEAGVTHADLDAVVFYEKPLLKFERLIETYLDVAPRGLTSFRRRSTRQRYLRSMAWASGPRPLSESAAGRSLSFSRSSDSPIPWGFCTR